MPLQSQSVSQPDRALSPNQTVTIICAVIAVFMLCVAAVCDAFMRSDAAMMAMAHPKICLGPPVPAKAMEPARDASQR